jgi:putative ABC transport system permease protein
MELAPANYRDLKQMATSFEALGAYRGLSVNLVGARQPLRLQGAAMTADALAALAVRPTMGRPFTAADDVDGAPATALVSYALWQQEFGGDASIVGRPVRLDGEVYTVIGVMPSDFNFPSRSAQLWTRCASFPPTSSIATTTICRQLPGCDVMSPSTRRGPRCPCWPAGCNSSIRKRTNRPASA